MSETSEKARNNETLTLSTDDVEAQHVAIEAADKQIEKDVPKKQISYLFGWRLHLLTLAYVQLLSIVSYESHVNSRLSAYLSAHS